MKTLVIYASSYRSTMQVVNKMAEYLTINYDVHNAKDPFNYELLSSYKLLLFFCPTYGDEELQEDMENFLVQINFLLNDQFFAMCELGNYCGYDDFVFGALPIMKQKLLSHGAKEFISPLSLDSLPKKDWHLLQRWCNLLEARYREFIHV